MLLIQNKVVNTLRKLSVEQITRANSGHPGVALGAAPILFSIYNSGATYSVKNPNWFNRDRIVVSGGHASSLIYSTLHLFGFDLSIKDLRNFRQVGSITPGHPEYDVTPGVDASTGALGQGFANAVGMAIAEAHLCAKYNTDNLKICNHYTFVVCGDGDLMEGVAYESAALAGHLKLNKLIALYDSNNISLDGETNISTSENVGLTFKSMGWNVITVKDGNNYLFIEKAIKKAKKSKTKPTLIICKTTIGYASELAGSNLCHGKPFNMQQTIEICDRLKVNQIPFEVDADVYQYCKKISDNNLQKEKQWENVKEQYKKQFKEKYNELFGSNVAKTIKEINKMHFEKDMATRDASKEILNKIAEFETNIFGGCADLSSATKAIIKNDEWFSSQNLKARNIAFGVREHAMIGCANGMALHGGIKPFVSTFLVFSDYCKYAIRMSAMMQLPLLYIFTHDSIAVGEDGATHQPVEHLEGLRMIPHLNVFRPADAVETVAGYQLWLEQRIPVVMALSRQTLPLLKNSNANNALKGGYVIEKESGDKPDIVLIATGSEVSLCVNVKEKLEKLNINTRVVSMPCREIFNKQDDKYKHSVLSDCENKISVEAGVTNGWASLVGEKGKSIGINTFGESGSAQDVAELFGLTEDNIIKIVKKITK